MILILRDGNRTILPASIGSIQHQPGCLIYFQRIAAGRLQPIQNARSQRFPGKPGAVHRIRIELTHLRAAALFFAPATDNAVWSRIDRVSAA
jgi:hypothetical protein